MKDDRQIADESWHNLYLLPHLNSEVNGQMFSKFLHDAEIIATINAHIYKAILHFKRQSKD